MGRKMATLYELQTVYSYEDALNMAEVLIVDSYNEYLAMKASQKK